MEDSDCIANECNGSIVSNGGAGVFKIHLVFHFDFVKPACPLNADPEIIVKTRSS